MIIPRLRRRAAVLALALTASLAPAAASTAADAATTPATSAPAAAAAATCPLVGDPLYAAADRSVDIDRVTPAPSYRTNCKQLYRADGRGPEVVFEQGFHPKAPQDGQYDIEKYVLVNQPSPFVSTTYDHDLYKQWKSAWNYYIDAPGGIDVNETIGDTHKWAAQVEVAFPGGISRDFIVGACPVDKQTKREIMSECLDNPHYLPWRL
ncbi:ADP-ribosyltransferase [Streptomyces sp. NPDC006283]|uniref:ADP-ribosyltransferase n=1 Tax=Streptomyces sp. NPDC006283 TaxID=3156741 RepID=UPI0033AD064E